MSRIFRCDRGGYGQVRKLVGRKSTLQTRKCSSHLGICGQEKLLREELTLQSGMREAVWAYVD